MKQMRLPQFLQEYGMSRTTADRLINRYDNPLPAYKLGGSWYVDIAKYNDWREIEDKRARS